MNATKKVPFFECEMELGGEMGFLRESNALLDDPEALRARMAEDGYLLLRGLQRRERIEAARRAILERLDAYGWVDRAHALLDGVVAEGTGGTRGKALDEARKHPDLVGALESPEIMGFFARFLGGPSLTFDYKWLRAMGRGGHTGGIHYDIVYMGRGTTNLYTCWTPLGDLAFENGPLALLVGSHKLPQFEKLKATYGKMDVDRDNIEGGFSKDPREMRERFGGEWQTTEFRMGDVLIFGMFTMHAALTNQTDTYRLSSDTRYQLASEPVDERWVGAEPLKHYQWGKTPVKEMAEARRAWGV